MNYPEGELPEAAEHFEVCTDNGTARITFSELNGWTWWCQVGNECDHGERTAGYDIPQDAEKAARRHLAHSHPAHSQATTADAQQEVRADG